MGIRYASARALEREAYFVRRTHSLLGLGLEFVRSILQDIRPSHIVTFNLLGVDVPRDGPSDNGSPPWEALGTEMSDSVFDVIYSPTQFYSSRASRAPPPLPDAYGPMVYPLPPVQLPASGIQSTRYSPKDLRQLSIMSYLYRRSLEGSLDCPPLSDLPPFCISFGRLTLLDALTRVGQQGGYVVPHVDLSLPLEADTYTLASAQYDPHRARTVWTERPASDGWSNCGLPWTGARPGCRPWEEGDLPPEPHWIGGTATGDGSPGRFCRVRPGFAVHGTL
jgi:hypothetical protein